jgi:hypothetical protein
MIILTYHDITHHSVLSPHIISDVAAECTPCSHADARLDADSVQLLRNGQRGQQSTYAVILVRFWRKPENACK